MTTPTNTINIDTAALLKETVFDIINKKSIVNSLIETDVNTQHMTELHDLQHELIELLLYTKPILQLIVTKITMRANKLQMIICPTTDPTQQINILNYKDFILCETLIKSNNKLLLKSQFVDIYMGIDNLEIMYELNESSNESPIDILEHNECINNKVTSFVIPNSMITIPSHSFSDNNLINISIPNSVITIENNAFEDNILTNVSIPDSVITIGNTAFACNQLTDITIGKSVTTIGFYAFDDNKLTNVTIPDSVITIGEFAFGDNKLTDITLSDSVTTIEKGSFYHNYLTHVTIPDSVITIGDAAFGNNQLTSVTIPQRFESMLDIIFDKIEHIKFTYI